MIHKLRTTPAKLFLLGTSIALGATFFLIKNNTGTASVVPAENFTENGRTNPDTSRDSEGDTFSIVAYDKTTGQVGGAACSCVSYTNGIDFLSDLITDGTNNPDNIVGAIHSQAAYNATTQAFARNRMLAGDTPQQIIDATVASDGNSASRQYGVVGVDSPGAAGFSGSSNGDYKNDQQGDNALYTYSIQGNILDTSNGQDLLDDMEAIFNSTTGSLGDKLMAALQAAKRVGGDSRCQSRGNSGRTAFIQVLSPGETSPGLAYDVGDSVAAVADLIEPIDVLQCLYDAGENTPFCRQTVSSFPYTMDFEQKSWEQEVATCSVNSSWIRSRFASPTGGTGPSGPSQGTLYSFVESSSVGGQGTSPRNAIIGSPCFEIPVGEITKMTFDYHMFGTSMGSLAVTVNDGSGWTSEWSESGNQGDIWNTTEIDLSAYAGSTIKIRIDATTGNGSSSDMAIDNIKIFQEGPVNCTTSINTFPYTESLESDLGDWSQASGDDGNWTENTGGTPSNNTGPSASSYGASYIYLESSDPVATGQPTAIGFNATAILEGPCFDLTTMPAAYFNFDYHMFGATSGSLTLQASSIEGVWNNIFSVSGQNVNDWIPTSVNLSAYLGGNVRLRFVGVTGSSFTSDIAIDSFVLSSCSGITKTWKGNEWSSAGTPNGNNPILIDDAFSTATASSLDGCFIEVNTGSTLTVAPDDYLNITNDITINGTLLVAHTANVVQSNDDALVTNNGTINVNITTPVLQTRDFMVMGSPMTGDTRDGVFQDAFLVLNHHPMDFIPYDGIPAGATNFSDQNGNFWNSYSGAINPGEGYIVRPQSGYNDPANESYDMTYEGGTLNNGTITRPAIFNGAVDNPDGTPIVFANPYASAISASDFVSHNTLVNEIYFWEHLTPPSVIVPGEGLRFDMDDVSIYNGSMGTPASNDPGTSTTPNGVISTGQGFAIKSFGTGDVEFTNAMRLTSGNTTLRTSESTSRSENSLVLNLTGARYQRRSNTGIAFNPQGTAHMDPNLDTRRLGTIVSLFSHLETGDEELGIQTLGDLTNGTKVFLGFQSLIEAEDEFTISLSTFTGDQLFEASIYLYDKVTGITTNLKDNNYQFRSGKTKQDRRFTVFFETEESTILDIGDATIEPIIIYPNPAKNQLNIITPISQEVQSIKIIDVLGKTLVIKNSGIESHSVLDVSNLHTGVYFVEINNNGKSIIKRFIKQ